MINMLFLHGDSCANRSAQGSGGHCLTLSLVAFYAMFTP